MDEKALADELRRHHGVTTRQRLRKLGVSDAAIGRALMRNRLVGAGAGVLVDPAAPTSFEQRVTVACALTRGVVRFPTAGVLWQFRKTPRVHEVHVCIPEYRRVTNRPGLAVHRTRDLPSTDVVTRGDGIALTSPPRTIFDAAALMAPADLESMIEQGLDRGNFTIVTLRRTCARLATNGRAGGSQLAAILASRPAWRRASRSDYEIRLERAMRARGFPPLTREHPVEIAPGQFIHPDLGLPADGFFVEVDHLTWHGGRREGADDRRRDMKVRLRGACVERVTDIAIETHLEETIEDLWVRWHQVRAAKVGFCGESRSVSGQNFPQMS